MPRLRLVACLLFTLLFTLVSPFLSSGIVLAQVSRPPLDRPGERPFLPDTTPLSEEPKAPLLPPSPEMRDPDPDLSDTGAGVYVETLRLRGNEVIGDEELRAAAQPFLGRELSPQQLQSLLVALSQVYLDSGYVNSGATLPSQEVTDGVLEVELVEGRLGEVHVLGLRHYREGVIAARLRRAIAAPLRVQNVEEVLRLLERDSRIRRLDARVRPTDLRGVAQLVVRIEEESPFWTDFGLDNYEPPSVGTLTGRIAAGHDNPLGLGDRFYAEGTVTEGLWRVEVGYEIPVNSLGTTIGFEARITDADIVQPPFDELDIESNAQSYAAMLRHPLVRSVEHDLWIGLVAEHRRGRTSLLGKDTPLSLGSDGGRIRLNLLRPFVEWTVRREDFAVALRSIFSFGLDMPSTTKSSGGTPDGRFFAWLGQARGVYRHPASQVELHARFDLQLSDDALLPLEQFAIGGNDSVRGYPRNVLVRDQGLLGSLEARVPVWTSSKGMRMAELIPFVDLGRTWNRDRVTPGKRTLSSIGLGLRLRPVPPLILDVQWAQPIRDVRAGSSLQGRGLLLSARWSFR